MLYFSMYLLFLEDRVKNSMAGAYQKMPIIPLPRALYFVLCSCIGRAGKSRTFPHSQFLCVCFPPPLEYWREISKFTLTFNVKFSRNYWRSDTQNINGKCASGTRYSLSLHLAEPSL